MRKIMEYVLNKLAFLKTSREVKRLERNIKEYKERIRESE